MPDLKTLQAEIEKLQNRILELEKVKADLTAQNGTPFKFGVNSSSEYGYMLNGVLVPFSKKVVAYNLIRVGTYDAYNERTYSCTGVPGYKSLTVNDFLFVATGLKFTVTDSKYLMYPFDWNLPGSKISYNASSGVLSVSYIGTAREYSQLFVKGTIYAKVRV